MSTVRCCLVKEIHIDFLGIYDNILALLLSSVFANQVRRMSHPDKNKECSSLDDDGLFKDFERQFKRLIKDLSCPVGQQFVVALGGGADSQTVLDLIDRIRIRYPQFNYLAIHLDHAFHPKSKAWADGIVNDCSKRQFPAIVESLEVPNSTRKSKEAQGRDARYLRLRDLTQPDAIILLGHHRNDQIETFLLQLKRGSGAKGLSSMARLANFHEQRKLWRPLLHVSKKCIYEYAHENKLHWIEDDTNKDTSIDRNFLRHDVVPILENRWPHFGVSVQRSSELCAEQEGVLDELLGDVLKNLETPEGALDTKPLKSRSARYQRALLRRWLANKGTIMPSFAVLDEVRKQIIYSPNDKSPKIAWGKWEVFRDSARNMHVRCR